VETVSHRSQSLQLVLLLHRAAHANGVTCHLHSVSARILLLQHSSLTRRELLEQEAAVAAAEVALVAHRIAAFQLPAMALLVGRLWASGLRSLLGAAPQDARS
jgi:hypothetical protein